MKKLKLLIILLCLPATTFGMLATRITRHVSARPVITRLASTTDNQYKSTINITEKCYNDLNTIKTDISKLKYYCEGVFSEIGKRNNPNIKPSDVINWLQKEPATNTNTQLQFASASAYIQIIQTKNDALDALFAEKYAETQNVEQTWQWFNDYFAEHTLRQPVSEYLQDMVERDAKRVEFAKQGIFFSQDGRTIIIDPSRVE